MSKIKKITFNNPDPNGQMSFAKLLLFNETCYGSIAYYEKYANSWLWMGPQQVPAMVDGDGKEGVIPTYELNSLNKHFNYDFRTNLNQQENIEFFKLVTCAAFSSGNVKHSSEMSLIPIVDCMSLIEDRDLEVDAIVCSSMVFRRLSLIEHKHLFIYRRGERIQKNGIVQGGTFFDIPIYVTSFVPKNTLFMFPKKEFLGIMAIRQDMVDIDVDPENTKIDLSLLKDGALAYEDIGMCITNEYHVAGIIFDLNKKKIENVVENDEKSAE